MSRGPGKVMRAIMALMQTQPDGAWTTSELCAAAYPDIRNSSQVQKKHRAAVSRAFSVIKQEESHWFMMEPFRATSETVLFNRASLKSWVAAQLKAGHCDSDDMQPGAWAYEFSQPGGSWDLMVKVYIALHEYGDESDVFLEALEREVKECERVRQEAARLDEWDGYSNLYRFVDAYY